ncbi:MAG TPA: hypothetical protein PLD20_20395 [Blastocatellia bacterium]|nr:hypothetical protein [Blastocatellia bacterium]HMX26219.1 hypothetical protein [Blastocatellia bacterium]HMY72677.1 hypothetical protein [Blastocatellia bacterium]HMZ20308.1 hypothetical protein [Blastocatellia bacterium]HNG28795.1 hypothetical protein [Blastocatellia bacterium]
MTKKRISAKLKRLVRQRAQGYCEYCLSPAGRATIRALDLNRKGVIRLRRLLLLDHEHPPKHRS